MQEKSSKLNTGAELRGGVSKWSDRKLRFVLCRKHAKNETNAKTEK